MESKWLNNLVKALLLLGMAVGAALLVTLLSRIQGATAAFASAGKPGWYAIAAGVLAVICILGAEYIALTLFLMMRTLSGDPFVVQNVIALRRIGFAALGVTACGLLTLPLNPVPLAVIAAFPVGICGLFALVLANVFSRAVAYKQENDLTV